MTQVREALQAMGYTEVKQGAWLKPIGYQCFAFNESKNEWQNWYRSARGHVELFESHVFGDLEKQGMYVEQLKYFECFTRTDVSVKNDSKFELAVQVASDLI